MVTLADRTVCAAQNTARGRRRQTAAYGDAFANEPTGPQTSTDVPSPRRLAPTLQRAGAAAVSQAQKLPKHKAQRCKPQARPAAPSTARAAAMGAYRSPPRPAWWLANVCALVTSCVAGAAPQEPFTRVSWSLEAAEDR